MLIRKIISIMVMYMDKELLEMLLELIINKITLKRVVVVFRNLPSTLSETYKVKLIK